MSAEVTGLIGEPIVHLVGVVGEFGIQSLERASVGLESSGMVELVQREAKFTSVRCVSEGLRKTCEATHIIHGLFELKTDPV